jgi:hypothetical protein
VIISDNFDLHKPLCGQYSDDIFARYYYSKRNKMSVEFHSDNNNDTIARRGFSCYYQTFKEHVTSSPNYDRYVTPSSANSNEGKHRLTYCEITRVLLVSAYRDQSSGHHAFPQNDVRTLGPDRLVNILMVIRSCSQYTNTTYMHV